ncbi:MAG: arginine N-succinyltransferase [Phycisphaerales bacterium]|nr:arginine N-succinyltransferase [Phycisphaerales bacterium]
MFIVRQATLDDLQTLLKMARMVHFINLPADKEMLSAKIARSRRSFASMEDDPRQREWMFVVEDTESRSVVGTSCLISTISWPGHPHIFLEVGKREHYSKDLNTGQVHVTIKLGIDESGPSEVGGLILLPGYRNHPARIGSLISLVRFHFMGRHRELFSTRVLAEMMGALTPDSRTPLWEYLGHRFINLSYTEADLFCQKSKEFILSLFPPGEIYTSILPPEARNLIGRVGEETEAARAILERQGFAYRGHVDPFDGGPYLEAKRDEIPIVKATKRAKLAGATARGTVAGIVSCVGTLGFRALCCNFAIDGRKLRLPASCIRALGAEIGSEVAYTPLPRRTKSAKSTRGGTKPKRPRA